MIKRNTKGMFVKGSNKKHGLSREPIYNCWVSMKARCNNERNPNYKHYGGRGIKVCLRWVDSFESFLKDMGHKPSRLHTLDRIDNNKGYNKSNCRWISIQEQQKNRRNSNECPGVSFESSRNRWHASITYKGKKYFLGRFSDFSKAVKVRLDAEIKYWKCLT